MNVAWRVEKTDHTLQPMKTKTLAAFIGNNLHNKMTFVTVSRQKTHQQKKNEQTISLNSSCSLWDTDDESNPDLSAKTIAFY